MNVSFSFYYYCSLTIKNDWQLQYAKIIILRLFIYLQAYVSAINSGVENIQEALLSPEAQKQLISTGPRLVHHSTKAHKTIDTEDTDLKYSAQPDGTLVTEKRQTTEHEEFKDDELPEEDDHSNGNRERIEQKVNNSQNEMQTKLILCSAFNRH